MTAHEHLEKYNPVLKDELQKVRRRGEVCKEMQRFAEAYHKDQLEKAMPSEDKILKQFPVSKESVSQRGFENNNGIMKRIGANWCKDYITKN